MRLSSDNIKVAQLRLCRRWAIQSTSKCLPEGRKIRRRLIHSEGRPRFKLYTSDTSILDCARPASTMWRYYPEGREAFTKYLETMKKIYPVLDVTNAQFRLFKTTEFGHDYQLP